MGVWITDLFTRNPLLSIKGTVTYGLVLTVVLALIVKGTA